jgi:hypothetical protein
MSRMHRLPGHQERIERPVVVIADIGEMVIGKGRIEMLPVTTDARAHGAPEGLLRPASDSGRRIRRNIGRVDGAERSRHRKAAGEARATAYRVAIAAIADRRQLATALDQHWIEGLR